MTGEIKIKIQELFDEGWAEHSPGEMLGIAGQKLLREKKRFQPDSFRYRDYVYRSDSSSEGVEPGHQEGLGLLLKWLPGLRKAVCDTTGQYLREEFKKAFGELTRQSLSLFLEAVGSTIFPLVGHAFDAAIFTAASLLKRGLSCILKTDGISIIEAEAYVDFDVKILDSTVLAFSPQGEVSEELVFDEKRLASDMTVVATYDANSSFWRQCGDYLWSILFPGEIRSLFERFVGSARENNRMVRLRLTVDNPKLVQIPWELARYPGTGDFLAVSDDILVTRYLHHFKKANIKNVRLKNLALLMPEPANVTPLSTAKEAARLQAICDGVGVRLNRVEPPTPAGLRQSLQDFPVEVFHFIGHGIFRDGTGYIALEDGAGNAELYSSDRLAIVLEDQKGLQIVYLSSCEGAVSNDFRSFTGMAPRLVQKGVPVVIAMQFPVKDSSALLFAQEFYRFLSKGFPVAYAVQKGRKTLFNDVGDTSIDFVTPLIFMGY
jgi:hypothetical protein